MSRSRTPIVLFILALVVAACSSDASSTAALDGTADAVTSDDAAVAEEPVAGSVQPVETEEPVAESVQPVETGEPVAEPVQPVESVQPVEPEELVVEAVQPTATSIDFTREPASVPFQGDSSSVVHETTSDDFPDIIRVAARPESEGGKWRFDVTVSSTYDTPERYADAWRLLDPDGNEFAVRELNHDHRNEQPFTRSLSFVAIPAEVALVTVQGRDLVNGWGGGVVTVDLSYP